MDQVLILIGFVVMFTIFGFIAGYSLGYKRGRTAGWHASTTSSPLDEENIRKKHSII